MLLYFFSIVCLCDTSTPNQVVIAAVSHLFPFRTEKLSPLRADGTAMQCGRVGSCLLLNNSPENKLLFPGLFCVSISTCACTYRSVIYLPIPTKIPPEGGSMRKGGWVEGSKENVVLIEKKERKVVQAKQNREQ